MVCPVHLQFLDTQGSAVERGQPLELQRCPRGDRHVREQQRLPAVAPEGRKRHPPRPWPGRHPAARPPFSREEVGDTVGNRPRGLMDPPGSAH